MISLKLKSSTWIAITSFILGLFIAVLLTGNCSGPSSPNQFLPAQLLKKQADSLQAVYHGKLSALEQANADLQKRLSQTKFELQTLKLKNKSKAAAIKKITQPPGYPAHNLLLKVSTPDLQPTFGYPSQITATEANNSTCDSLKSLINDYLQEVELKDSLYESVLLQQDSLLAVKDDMITLQSKQLENFSQLLNETLSGQQTLARENSRLLKKLKRHRRGTRLLTLGTALLSGLATHYLTR